MMDEINSIHDSDIRAISDILNLYQHLVSPSCCCDHLQYAMAPWISSSDSDRVQLLRFSTGPSATSELVLAKNDDRGFVDTATAGGEAPTSSSLPRAAT